MLTQPNAPAFATCERDGLTTREYFAALAMQGILAGRTPVEALTQEDVAREAVELADALIGALNGAGDRGPSFAQVRAECVADEGEPD